MKILIIHNHYLERGGEDAVFESERKMLRNNGHQVHSYERSNSEIRQFGFFQKLKFVFKDIFWSKEIYNEISEIIKNFNPDIAHIHNPFIMMSPALYAALKDKNVPIVQTLHNYRLGCFNGLFYKNGQVCEQCLKWGSFLGVIRKCWRKSFLQSMLFYKLRRKYNKLKVFEEIIDRYIALSEFSRKKLIECGIPEDKISVKQNFIESPFQSKRIPGEHVLFVGRLSDYKGIKTLIKAFQALPEIKLKIVGDGPLKKDLKFSLCQNENIEIMGSKFYEETLNILKDSAFLVFPSECYENMPRTIIEGFACGVPVVASDIGAIPELIKNGETGLLFSAGDANDLYEKIRYLIQNKELVERMGKIVFNVYKEKYTPDKNYNMLMDVYKKALAVSK